LISFPPLVLYSVSLFASLYSLTSASSLLIDYSFS